MYPFNAAEIIGSSHSSKYTFVRGLCVLASAMLPTGDSLGITSAS